MLKIITLLLLPALCTISFVTAQTTNCKAYQTAWIPLPPDNATYSWEDIDVPVVLNFTTNKVSIKGNDQQVFDLLKLRRKFTDEKNDQFAVYNAKDEKGTACKLTIQTLAGHSADHNFNILIKYFDKEIVYRLRLAAN